MEEYTAVSMESMKGVITQLKTFSRANKVMDTEIVFRPTCDWFVPDLHDYIGSIRFDDIGEVIKNFGTDVAEKVIAGEIVEVEMAPSPRYRLTSCTERTFSKHRVEIMYPWPGAIKEYLVGLLPEKKPKDQKEVSSEVGSS